MFDMDLSRIINGTYNNYLIKIDLRIIHCRQYLGQLINPLRRSREKTCVHEKPSSD